MSFRREIRPPVSGGRRLPAGPSPAPAAMDAEALMTVRPPSRGNAGLGSAASSPEKGRPDIFAAIEGVLRGSCVVDDVAEAVRGGAHVNTWKGTMTPLMMAVQAPLRNFGHAGCGFEEVRQSLGVEMQNSHIDGCGLIPDRQIDRRKDA